MSMEDLIAQARAQQAAFRELAARAPQELHVLIRTVEPSALDVLEWEDQEQAMWASTRPARVKKVWGVVLLATLLLGAAAAVDDLAVRFVLGGAVLLAAMTTIANQWSEYLDDRVSLLAVYYTHLWRRSILATHEIAAQETRRQRAASEDASISEDYGDNVDDVDDDEE